MWGNYEHFWNVLFLNNCNIFGRDNNRDKNKSGIIEAQMCPKLPCYSLKPPYSPAAAHTWLSFSMIMEDRSYRWPAQPPTRSAYFSTIRKPGVVLRVPATSPCQLLRCFISTMRQHADAIPLARDIRLSAMRSPSSMSFTFPLISATVHIGSNKSPVLFRKKKLIIEHSTDSWLGLQNRIPC